MYLQPLHCTIALTNIGLCRISTSCYTGIRQVPEIKLRTLWKQNGLENTIWNVWTYASTGQIMVFYTIVVEKWDLEPGNKFWIRLQIINTNSLTSICAHMQVEARRRFTAATVVHVHTCTHAHTRQSV